MTNPLSTFINDIDTRLKRLEENIGSATDSVLSFLSLRDDIGVSDYLYIYKREVNTSFLLGHSKLGVGLIGDRRGAPTEVYVGGGL